MDNLLQIIKIGNKTQMADELVKFYTERSNLTPNPFHEEMAQKKALVDALFAIVLNPENKCKLAPLAMQVLRLTTRDLNLANSAYNSERIETLLHLANLVGEKETNLNESDHELFDIRIVVEAQKCLCNLLCLSPIVRNVCSSNWCLPGIMCRLRMHPDPNLPNDVKLFDMRMLFFLTCHLPEVRNRVRTEYHGLIYLMETIDLMLKNNAEAQSTSEGPSRGSRRRSKGSRRGRRSQNDEKNNDDSLVAYCLDDTEVEIIAQVLKVLFNLTMHINQSVKLDEFEEAHYFRLVSILHDLLLCDTKKAERKLELQSRTVELLCNMPGQSYEELLSKISELGRPENPDHEYDEMNMEVIAVLLSFLQFKLDDTSNAEYEDRLMPILTTLMNACRAISIIRKYVRYQILPPLRDVSTRPEMGNAIRNKLVRCMTSTNTTLKTLAASFLFVLCKENVNRLIKYTGYGNSAGLMMDLGKLRMPTAAQPCYSSDSEESETEEYIKNIDKINPIIGCIDEKKSDPFEGMTEEQKEYEANNLANMIDKLQRTGIIQPCRIGEDGKAHPIEHVLQLQEAAAKSRSGHDSDSD